MTDADLLLGLLNQDFFLGGREKLDVAAAERAMRAHLGPLGQDPVSAAAGIYDVVNASMAAALRTVTLQRGVDPRGLPMVVGGGAGPVHAAAIAAELGVQVVLVPRTSSTFCALGTLLLDFRHEYVRSCFGRLDDLDPERVTALCEQMARDGRATLAAEGRDEGSTTVSYAADLRYGGQFHEVTVPTDLAELRNGGRAALARRFHDRHFELYGYASPELPVELVNLRLSAIGVTEKPELPRVQASAGGPEAALKGTRRVFMGQAGEWVETPVYDGLRLGFGDHVRAPALIELPTTTVAVLSPFEVLVDRLGTFTLFQPDAADDTRRRVLDGR